MASIAIMVGGAVLNAAAFIGGNYLASALGGDDKSALEETERHDRAIEDYQAAYAKYATAPNFSTGLRPTPRSRLRPSRTSPTPTTPSNSTTRRILTN